MSKSLPAQFADLGRFTDKWILPTEAARHNTRLSSTFEELTDLYNTMLPRMEGIIEYLNGFKLGELPEKEDNLMKLALGFMEVTCAVECFKRAGIRGFDPSRMKVYM
ncbi:MAG: hypothetical protein WAX67_07005 [Rugosibacter sp.]